MSVIRHSFSSKQACFEKKAMKFSFAFLLSALWCVLLSAQPQNRVVLIEQFTNSGCSSCASSTPSVYQFARNNPTQIALIAYHTSFPYLDSMHLENPADAAARTAFYGINGVPHSILDGNQYRAGSAAFSGQMQGRLNQRVLMSPTYALSLSDLSLRSDSLFVNVVATSLDSLQVAADLKLFVVVVEDLVQKSSYAASPGANSLTSYSFVMRKILPQSGGYSLMNKGLGESDSLTLSWKLQKIKSVSQLRVVVFVQNMTTKEIYQANISSGLATSVGEVKKTQTFKVFPQPTAAFCSVQGFDLPVAGWEIRNIQGQFVARLEATFFQDGWMNFELPPLNNGMYFIGNSRQVGFQKLMIQN